VPYATDVWDQEERAGPTGQRRGRRYKRAACPPGTAAAAGVGKAASFLANETTAPDSPAPAAASPSLSLVHGNQLTVEILAGRRCSLTPRSALRMLWACEARCRRFGIWAAAGAAAAVVTGAGDGDVGEGEEAEQAREL
jgi:hypothetical protein